MSFENDKEARTLQQHLFPRIRTVFLRKLRVNYLWITCLTRFQASDLKELPIIVKADVQGSVEAVKQSLVKLSNDEVVVKE